MTGVGLCSHAAQSMAVHLLVVRVADVLLAEAATHKEPAEAAADSFDDVPGVEGVKECAETQHAAMIMLFRGGRVVVTVGERIAWVRRLG